MKIKCKSYNATVSHTTCVARHAVIKHGKNSDDLLLLLCKNCKKGIRLYEKAGCPLPRRQIKHFHKPDIIQNHDWLSQRYSQPRT